MRRPAALLLGGAALVALGGSATRAEAVHDLVLRHVAVVDPRTAAVRPDMEVVIDAGSITAVRRAGRAAPAATRTVEAQGEFLIPGLLDMHAHPLGSGDEAGNLELMLANGITGWRQMSGSPELLQRRREGKLIPTADAPRLLAMPGTILTRISAPTPEAAVAEIDRQKLQGADFIKLTDATPDTFFAAVAEARRKGLTLVGHLPPTINVRQASAAGMHSIEHLGPRDSVFLGCSTQEAQLRASIRAPREPALPPGPPPPPAMMSTILERLLSNPILSTSPADFPRYGRVLDSFDAAKCDELAREFVRNDTWQVPTLIRLRTMELADDPAYLADPNLKYVAPASLKMWRATTAQFHTQLLSQRPSLGRLFRAQLDLVRRFRDDGVPMMAGSDFGGGLVISGFGLHQELDLLAQAGLTPIEVLRMATVNGARFLHMDHQLGTVAPGFDADLVLLRADPTRSVEAMHQVDGVVRGGRFYGRSDLDAILARVAAHYAAVSTAAPAARPG